MTQKSINAIRFLGVDAVNQAKSGHPGIVLGAAPMAYTLFTKELTVNPDQPQWFNRDRFVLSAGHGSALLYALLHLSQFRDVTVLHPRGINYFFRFSKLIRANQYISIFHFKVRTCKTKPKFLGHLT